ncbi:MAG: tape measure protein [Burkholderiales bacterium]
MAQNNFVIKFSGDTRDLQAALQRAQQEAQNLGVSLSNQVVRVNQSTGKFEASIRATSGNVATLRQLYAALFAAQGSGFALNEQSLRRLLSLEEQNNNAVKEQLRLQNERLRLTTQADNARLAALQRTLETEKTILQQGANSRQGLQAKVRAEELKLEENLQRALLQLRERYATAGNISDRQYNAQRTALLEQYRNKVLELQRAIVSQTGGLNNLVGALNRTGSATLSLDSINQGLLTRIFNVVAGYRLVNSLLNQVIATIKQIPEAGIAEQGLEAALTGVFGTIGARENIQFVHDIAEQYGQDILTLEAGYKKFAPSARIAGAAQAEVNTVFKDVSAVSTILSLTKDKVNSIFLALEQAYAKSTLQAQELKLQLANALPGVFEVAAIASKKSIPEFIKAMEQGLLKSREIVPAIFALYRKIFAGEGEAVLKKFVNQYLAESIRFGNRITELERDVFDKIKNIATEFYRLSTTAIDNLRENFEGLLSILELFTAYLLTRVIGALVATRIAVAATAIQLALFRREVTFIGVTGLVFTRIEKGFIGLRAALLLIPGILAGIGTAILGVSGPVLTIIATVAALTVGVYALSDAQITYSKNQDRFKAAIQSTNKELTDAIAKYKLAATTNPTDIVNLTQLKRNVEEAKVVLQFLTKSQKEASNDINITLQGRSVALTDFLVEAAKQVGEYLKDQIVDFSSYLTEQFATLGNYLKEQAIIFSNIVVVLAEAVKAYIKVIIADTRTQFKQFLGELQPDIDKFLADNPILGTLAAKLGEQYDKLAAQYNNSLLQQVTQGTQAGFTSIYNFIKDDLAGVSAGYINLQNTILNLIDSSGTAIDKFTAKTINKVLADNKKILDAQIEDIRNTFVQELDITALLAGAEGTGTDVDLKAERNKTRLETEQRNLQALIDKTNGLETTITQLSNRADVELNKLKGDRAALSVFQTIGTFTKQIEQLDKLIQSTNLQEYFNLTATQYNKLLAGSIGNIEENFRTLQLIASQAKLGFEEVERILTVEKELNTTIKERTSLTKDLDNLQKIIAIDVEQGFLSEIAGKEKLKELDEARLIHLRENLRLIQEALNLEPDSLNLRTQLEDASLGVDLLERKLRAIPTSLKLIRDIGTELQTTLTSAFSNAFVGFVTGAESASSAMLSFAKTVLTAIANIAAQKFAETIIGLLFSFVGAGISKAVGVPTQGLGGAGLARGGIIDKGNITSFASGGVVAKGSSLREVIAKGNITSFASGGVVAKGSSLREVINKGNITSFASGGIIPDIGSKKQVFRLASGGFASLRESGPEAILPLRRNSAGRLGVETTYTGNSNSTGGGITIGAINITVDQKEGETSEEQAQKIGKAIHYQLKGLITREIADAVRPGNTLNPTRLSAFSSALG